MKKIPKSHFYTGICPDCNSRTEIAPKKIRSEKRRNLTFISGCFFIIFFIGFLTNLIRGDLVFDDFDSWAALAVVIGFCTWFVHSLKNLIKFENNYHHCEYCKTCDEIWYSEK